MVNYLRMFLALREIGGITGIIQAIALNLATLASLLFDFCLDCDLNKLIKNMPVVQGAFAACKVKERNMKIAKMHQSNDQEQEKMFYHGKYLELSPLKYNSKLMNSIWGLYNRYSVHNFKKNTDGANINVDAGSQNGVPAADKMSAIKSNKSSPYLVNDWTNIWRTHNH